MIVGKVTKTRLSITDPFTPGSCHAHRIGST